jgi:uncharacterized protein YggU (UPF0235/DUF167 family)
MRVSRQFATKPKLPTNMRKNSPAPAVRLAGEPTLIIHLMQAASRPAVSKIPSSIVSKGNALHFTIQAKPGSKRSQISEIADEFIGVNIGARPVDGEANDELLEYLGSVLQVRLLLQPKGGSSSKRR